MRAVVPEEANGVGYGAVICRHGSAISDRSEILCRIEAPGCGVPEAADAPIQIFGSMSLRGIFENGDPMDLSKACESIHVRGLAI